MGDHLTLKNLFNNLFNNMLDEMFILSVRAPIIHPLCDFVALTTQFYFAFLSEKNFNFFLCGCVNVSIYVCRYASV